MNDYGHIDSDTPSLAMSVYQKYRGLGNWNFIIERTITVRKIVWVFKNFLIRSKK